MNNGSNNGGKGRTPDSSADRNHSNDTSIDKSNSLRSSHLSLDAHTNLTRNSEESSSRPTRPFGGERVSKDGWDTSSRDDDESCGEGPSSRSGGKNFRERSTTNSGGGDDRPPGQQRWGCMLFTIDLRLSDHYVIHRALQAYESGEVDRILPVYIYDERVFGRYTMADVVDFFGEGAVKKSDQQADTLRDLLLPGQVCPEESWLDMTLHDLLKMPSMSSFKEMFLESCLKELRKDLVNIDANLVIMEGLPAKVLADLLPKGSIVFHETQADQAVHYSLKQEIEAEGLIDCSVWNYTLYEPGDLAQSGATVMDLSLTSPDGFVRHMHKRALKVRALLPVPIPGDIIMPTAQDCESLVNVHGKPLDYNKILRGMKQEPFRYRPDEPMDPRSVWGDEMPKGGTAAGIKRLFEFVNVHLETYANTRNNLKGMNYSSKLSIWMQTGCISVREVFWATIGNSFFSSSSSSDNDTDTVESKNNSSKDSSNKDSSDQTAAVSSQNSAANSGNGVVDGTVSNVAAAEDKSTKPRSVGAMNHECHFVFELLYRDFFRFAIEKHGEKTMTIGGVRPNTEIIWNSDLVAAVRFLTGRTGYGFIDACMRELRYSGYMSTRGRQNIASFCVNSLWLDWRVGARYLESTLIDHELCCNYGNWINSSGQFTGRRSIFNVIKQAYCYDCDGEFTKLWVPELKDCPVKYIHEPWAWADFDKCSYVQVPSKVYKRFTHFTHWAYERSLPGKENLPMPPRSRIQRPARSLESKVMDCKGAKPVLEEFSHPVEVINAAIVKSCKAKRDKISKSRGRDMYDSIFAYNSAAGWQNATVPGGTHGQPYRKGGQPKEDMMSGHNKRMMQLQQGKNHVDVNYHNNAAGVDASVSSSVSQVGVGGGGAPRGRLQPQGHSLSDDCEAGGLDDGMREVSISDRITPSPYGPAGGGVEVSLSSRQKSKQQPKSSKSSKGGSSNHKSGDGGAAMFSAEDIHDMRAKALLQQHPDFPEGAGFDAATMAASHRTRDVSSSYDAWPRRNHLVHSSSNPAKYSGRGGGGGHFDFPQPSQQQQFGGRNHRSPAEAPPGATAAAYRQQQGKSMRHHTAAAPPPHQWQQQQHDHPAAHPLERSSSLRGQQPPHLVQDDPSLAVHPASIPKNGSHDMFAAAATGHPYEAAAAHSAFSKGGPYAGGAGGMAARNGSSSNRQAPAGGANAAAAAPPPMDQAPPPSVKVNFCHECGNPVHVASAKFCTACGAPLAPVNKVTHNSMPTNGSGGAPRYKSIPMERHSSDPSGLQLLHSFPDNDPTGYPTDRYSALPTFPPNDQMDLMPPRENGPFARHLGNRTDPTQKHGVPSHFHKTTRTATKSKGKTKKINGNGNRNVPAWVSQVSETNQR